MMVKELEEVVVRFSGDSGGTVCSLAGNIFSERVEDSGPNDILDISLTIRQISAPRKGR